MESPDLQTTVLIFHVEEDRQMCLELAEAFRGRIVRLQECADRDSAMDNAFNGPYYGLAAASSEELQSKGMKQITF